MQHPWHSDRPSVVEPTHGRSTSRQKRPDEGRSLGLANSRSLRSRKTGQCHTPQPPPPPRGTPTLHSPHFFGGGMAASGLRTRRLDRLRTPEATVPRDSPSASPSPSSASGGFRWPFSRSYPVSPSSRRSAGSFSPLPSSRPESCCGSRAAVVAASCGAEALVNPMACWPPRPYGRRRPMREARIVSLYRLRQAEPARVTLVGISG